MPSSSSSSARLSASNESTSSTLASGDDEPEKYNVSALRLLHKSFFVDVFPVSASEGADKKHKPDSEWTKLHRPFKRTALKEPTMFSQVYATQTEAHQVALEWTVKLACEHGLEKVRGWPIRDVELDPDAVASFTTEAARILNQPIDEIENALVGSLPIMSEETKAEEKAAAGRKPKKKRVVRKPQKKRKSYGWSSTGRKRVGVGADARPGACCRCGRYGHWQEDCYAKTDANGDPIDEFL